MRVRAAAVGWRAHAALRASAGQARVVAPHRGSCWAEADGELMWLGPTALLHARTVVVAAPLTAMTGEIAVACDGLVPWRAEPCRVPADTLRACAHELRAALAAGGAPRALGHLLGEATAGAPARARSPEDDRVVARARPHAARLRAACAADDPAGAIEPARALLGLGEGLTPSGDDFVGGALFARRACGGPRADWELATGHILADAIIRTHPVSARLLGDLANGEGWAPLHELTAALATRDGPGAQRAARALVTLGSSSGWDILAGFLGVLTHGEPGTRTSIATSV